MSWRLWLKSKPKSVNLGFYGEVNAGKTTLANKIGLDWADQEVGIVSEIPHETRDIQKLEKVNFSANGTKLDLTLIDMPGIATSVNPKEFLKHGLSASEAMQRAKEATRGIIEAIKYLEQVDVALVIIDASKSPFDQVNFTIIGNLEHQKKPFILVPNKIDLVEADVRLVRDAFSQYHVVPVSAIQGDGIDELYDKIAELAKKVRR
ncbi:MAG: 50S ribosome-binding GTPase [Candidatus Heimdallarchaeota archaeon]|nr:50S ribosome-binding GTPase [Candidatus Heimdallarchaeota archaeon]MCK4254821.1 50S ribosome-binding GTPase [Candidatus Heimdallarchaeota archaeon]